MNDNPGIDVINMTEPIPSAPYIAHLIKKSSGTVMASFCSHQLVDIMLIALFDYCRKNDIDLNDFFVIKVKNNEY